MDEFVVTGVGGQDDAADRALAEEALLGAMGDDEPDAGEEGVFTEVTVEVRVKCVCCGGAGSADGKATMTSLELRPALVAARQEAHRRAHLELKQAGWQLPVAGEILVANKWWCPGCWDGWMALREARRAALRAKEEECRS